MLCLIRRSPQGWALGLVGARFSMMKGQHHAPCPVLLCCCHICVLTSWPELPRMDKVPDRGLRVASQPATQYQLCCTLSSTPNFMSP